jgi:hypothetical protein
MTSLQRSAAICGALLALPIAAILAFRARDDVQSASYESRATEPAPVPVALVEQPAVSELARKATPAVAPAVPVAARLPTAPSPEQVRDYAVGADEHHGKPELAASDPAGVERPLRLELKAFSRATEDPQGEEP